MEKYKVLKNCDFFEEVGYPHYSDIDKSLQNKRFSFKKGDSLELDDRFALIVTPMNCEVTEQGGGVGEMYVEVKDLVRLGYLTPLNIE